MNSTPFANRFWIVFFTISAALLMSGCGNFEQSLENIVSETPPFQKSPPFTSFESRSMTCTSTPEPTKHAIPTLIETIAANKLTPPVALQTQTPTQVVNAVDKTPIPATFHPTPTLHWMTNQNEYLGKLVKMEHKAKVIYLKDLKTGGVREIRLNHLQFLGWAHEGCGLYLRMFDSNIIEIDLQGNIRRTVFDSSQWKERGFQKEADWVELAPSEQWGAYISGEGSRKEYPIYGYHFERENLSVMSIDGKQGPFMVSQHQGAWVYSWSPDSTSLVYIDRDEIDVHQLFISRYDGSQRLQITHFTSQKVYIDGVSWSPDGQFFLLFLEYPDKDYEVYLVRASDGFQINLGKYKTRNPHFFWDGNILGIWVNNKIEWLEPATGKTIRISEVAWDSDSIWLFGSNKMLYFYDRYNQWNLFFYDLTTNTYELLVDPHIENGLEYSFIPASFPGELFCTWP